MVGGGVGVPMEPLHRAGVKEGMASAGLKQAVHRTDGKPGHIALVPADTSPFFQFRHHVPIEFIHRLLDLIQKPVNSSLHPFTGHDGIVRLRERVVYGNTNS